MSIGMGKILSTQVNNARAQPHATPLIDTWLMLVTKKTSRPYHAISPQGLLQK